jgi:hypothetical protein
MDTRQESVSVAEAARMVGKSKQAILSRIKRGTLPASKVKIGNREVWRIKVNDLLKSEGMLPDAAHMMTRHLAKEISKILLEELKNYGYETMGASYRDQLGRKMGRMQHELGHEKGLREAAERKIAALERELEALRGAGLRLIEGG